MPPPQQPVRLEAGQYLIRTLTESDASDRWAAWPADPEAAYLLNAPARKLSQSDIITYIGSFDQQSRLLLGIFDQKTGTHVGFLTFSIDFAASRALVNLLIGEPSYRNYGVLTAIRRPMTTYIYETLGLQALLASVLAHNQVILDWLLKEGWILERTLHGEIRSQSGDKMLDVCLLKYPREAWQARERELAEKGKR